MNIPTIESEIIPASANAQYKLAEVEVDEASVTLRNLGSAGRICSKTKFLEHMGVDPSEATPERRRAYALYNLGRSRVMEQNKATGLAVVGKDGVEVHKFEVKHYKDGRRAFTIHGVEAPKCRSKVSTPVKASDAELLAEMKRRGLI